MRAWSAAADEPGHLLLAGFDPGGQRVDLPGETSQAFAPVSHRAGRGDERALGLGQTLLGGLPGGHGLGQSGLGLVELVAQTGFVVADGDGLGLERVGVAAGPPGGQGFSQVPAPFVGQPGRAAEPFVQGGQLVPGLLRAGQLRRSLGLPGVEFGLAVAGGRELGLRPRCARPDRVLVSDLGRQLGPQGQQVVGQQSQPGIAQFGLDPGGPAGDLGLATRAV